jgi:hypothetical protein
VCISLGGSGSQLFSIYAHSLKSIHSFHLQSLAIAPEEPSHTFKQPALLQYKTRRPFSDFSAYLWSLFSVTRMPFGLGGLVEGGRALSQVNGHLLKEKAAICQNEQTSLPANSGFSSRWVSVSLVHGAVYCGSPVVCWFAVGDLCFSGGCFLWMRKRHVKIVNPLLVLLHRLCRFWSVGTWEANFSKDAIFS